MLRHMHVIVPSVRARLLFATARVPSLILRGSRVKRKSGLHVALMTGLALHITIANEGSIASICDVTANVCIKI